MEVVISTLVSVPTGILTSFLFWWWFTRQLAPRISWSEALVAPPDDKRVGNDHDQLRLKIVNHGRRHALDLQVWAQLRLPHEVDHIGSPMHLIELPTSTPWLPRLQRQSYRYVRMCPNKIPPDEFERAGLDPDAELGDLLRRRPGAAIRVYLFAYDGFSGARKIFVSPDYTADELVEGSFEPGLSLVATRPALPDAE
ncbi:hypothetical protein [Cryptosporangium phraense]|uniref:Uncharacterized protein n=1 Tax=Cryptosporangium phraense TaxID=2593070 RepID=A0A545AEX2_9ACTN|nr:hypothetical protein [Cryptosporangium phraense]TQS39810.1 hypothetical protein FL583_37945 [Cryptosporangium phraense]